MAGSDTAALTLKTRPVEGSRATRRLRREGFVPAVVYGGGDEPQPVVVDAKELRTTLAHAHAVLEISVDGAKPSPVVVKEIQRHPVRGNTMHIDFMRVRLDQAIHATVTLELTGGDEAPGVTEGGVLSQGVRELNIEALPGDIPDSITFDVSGMAMNATATLAEVTVPPGVTLLDDLENVVATITPPTAEPVEEEIETETELVGEGEEAEVAEAEAEAEGATAEEAESGSSEES
jgi:large subunit ribosomal protein L25